MLILTRKIGEMIRIGDNITVRILDIRGASVSIGITAPNDICIFREELCSKDTFQKNDISQETSEFSVKEMRNRLSMTQEEFARALHLTTSTINRWENGHAKPSKLARAAIIGLAGDHGVFVKPFHRSTMEEE